MRSCLDMKYRLESTKRPSCMVRETGGSVLVLGARRRGGGGVGVGEGEDRDGEEAGFCYRSLEFSSSLHYHFSIHMNRDVHTGGA